MVHICQYPLEGHLTIPGLHTMSRKFLMMIRQLTWINTMHIVHYSYPQHSLYQ